MNNKDRIVEVAFLLSLKYGFDNVSTKQIQDASGISTGALYYHFKNKDDILRHILNNYFLNNLVVFKMIINNFEGTPIEKLKYLFYCNIGSCFEENISLKVLGVEVDYREYIMFLTGIYHQHPEFRELFDLYNHRTIEFYKELILDLFEKKELRDDVSLDDMSIFIFTIMNGFINLWRTFPNSSIEKFVDVHTEIILDFLLKKDNC